MRGPPTGFWGKLERDPSETVSEWHPLVAHCADVAACTEAMLERTVLRYRLAALAGREDLDAVDVARLCVIASLHDIGKFNLGFQRKGDAKPHDTAGHVAEVLALFRTDYEVKGRLIDALPFAALESWCKDGGALELLVAAVGHHGRPVRCGDLSADPSLWRIEGALDPFAGIADLSALTQEWFPDAFGRADGNLPDAPAFQHGFAGLVMLADWLGSDRAFFRFSDSVDDRMSFARAKAREAVRAIGLDVRAARASLGQGIPGFERVSGFAPYEAQTKTMALECPPKGGLTILESETGSGKTEAALGRFVQLFHAGLVDGMVFALPTRSAATQLHRRVVEAMKLAFPDESRRPSVVLAVPGYLQVDEIHGQRLPEFKVLWNDNDRERGRHHGWAAENPKRYLAGAVAVGTIDQVLLSSLRVAHAHLRATALLRQFLVVDEVHASDAYMNRILEEVLRFHLAAGGHAFLMSATLGSHVRRRLERAALVASSPNGAAHSLEVALATPYPVVHHAARGGSLSRLAVQTPGLPKVVHVTLEPIADDPITVASRALDAARANARVLVLRNTVTDAVATQRALEAVTTDADAPLLFRVGNVVTLHHARFAKTDRERLDMAIEDRFGKNAAPHRGMVAVATQTVQQSLDLDADVLLTDLAPMDVLLQRFGRVHRHPKRNPFRPARFDKARAVVMVGETPLEDGIRESGEAWGKHGAGTVYEDLVILEATRRRLAENGELVIPAQNRELVEVTTHPEALEEIVRSLGAIWQKHQIRVSGKRLAATGLADLNVVDRTQHFGDYSFKETDLPERISARLGESDRRAVFDEPPPAGPFGDRVRELTLPGWLTRAAPSDPKLTPTQVEVRGGPFGAYVRFAFGPLLFIYDRLGLRLDDDGIADVSEDVADA